MKSTKTLFYLIFVFFISFEDVLLSQITGEIIDDVDYTRKNTPMDFDGDEYPDYIKINDDEIQIVEYYNSNFSQILDTKEVYPTPHFVSHGDFDGDGLDDVIYGSSTKSIVRVIINDQGNLSETINIIYETNNPEILTSARIYDIDQDGDGDAFVGIRGEGIYLYENENNEVLERIEIFSTNYEGSLNMEFCDLNQDNQMDIVATNFYKGALSDN